MAAHEEDSDATVRPARALVSVSDKAGLAALGRALQAAGVEILSTGGTAAALREAGCEIVDVAEVTGFPEMMDGRVKTLHPMIHGPLLADRSNPAHREAMQAHGMRGVDVLVVNLYPFEAAVAAGADMAECIEKIDIGGPAMIRAAAKNHAHVAVVTDPSDYAELIAALDGIGLSLDFRRRLAAKAFARTAAYDSAIAARLGRETGERFPERLSAAGQRRQELRYGENPHQRAAFYADASGRPGVATAALVQGKALSYNNLGDTDAAYELVADLDRLGQPAVAIIKHANPCGAAIGDSLVGAHAKALLCDPVSAFGGVVAVNQPLDAEAAAAILKVFTEVVIAPGLTDEARALFAAKPDLRLLDAGALPDPGAEDLTLRTIAGGFLVQDRDAAGLDFEPTLATRREPTTAELADLRFAWIVAKHVKSNAVVFARGGATTGVGAGQMSRIDATRIAARKAEDAARAAGLEESLARGSVVASDAFYPFADGLLAAAEAGVTAAIQPGGSKRDDEVIAAADQAGMAMLLTGRRHFRH